MAGIAAAKMAKMKRKELEEVSDEFSEFSLSAPARKIRRLDAELAPIMEEEDPPVMMAFKDQQPPLAPNQPMMSTEMMPEFNEERSIVLYKPTVVNTPSSLLASCDHNVLYKVSPHILSGIKNQAFGPRNPNPHRRGVILEEIVEEDDMPDIANNCLAMVPWQAPLYGAPMSGNAAELRDAALEEMMDTDDTQGCVSMEVEDEYVGGAVATGVDGGEGGFHQQWQQQHCMAPQLPLDRSTPLMW